MDENKNQGEKNRKLESEGERQEERGGLSGWSVFLGDAQDGSLFRDGHLGGDTEDQWKRNEGEVSTLASSSPNNLHVC